jgi:hypothetical protein
MVRCGVRIYTHTRTVFTRIRKYSAMYTADTPLLEQHLRTTHCHQTDTRPDLKTLQTCVEEMCNTITPPQSHFFPAGRCHEGPFPTCRARMAQSTALLPAVARRYAR